MAVTQITLEGTERNGQGLPIGGTIDFLLSANLVDTGDNTVYNKRRITATVSPTTGEWSVVLCATKGDAGVTPTGATWYVRKRVGDGSRFRIELDAADGTPQNLADLTPVSDTTPVYGAVQVVGEDPISVETTNGVATVSFVGETGGPDPLAIVQGGNAFAAELSIGTTDDQPLSLISNNQKIVTVTEGDVDIAGAVYAHDENSTVAGPLVEAYVIPLVSAGESSALYGNSIVYDPGTQGKLTGVKGKAGVTLGATANVTEASGIAGEVAHGGAGTIAKATPIRGRAVTNTGAGAVTLAASVYGEAQTAGATNYSGYFEGDVHIGGDVTVDGTYPTPDLSGYATTSALSSEASTRASGDTTNAGNLTTHAALTTSAHGGIVASNDSRLTDARTPTAHATSHVTGGTDVIANAVAAGNAGLMSGADKTKLDGVASGATANSTDAQLRDRSTHTGTQAETTLALTDITTNNASTTRHGFLPKLDNNAAHFLDGTGAWGTPAGGGTSPVGYGTYASMPAAGTAGRLYTPSDGFSQWVDDGTNYRPLLAGIVGTKPPLVATFTARGAGTPNFADDKGALVWNVASNGTADSLKLLEVSAPATPWTLTVYMGYAMTGAVNMAGIYVADNTTKVRILTPEGSNFKVYNFTSLTVGTGSAASVSAIATVPIWLRIVDDGTNRIFSYSYDNNHYTTVLSEGRTSVFTATKVGLGLNPYQGPSTGSFLSYSLV